MNLDSKLDKVFRIDIPHKKALSRLGLFTVLDLLYYFPIRYSDFSQIKKIADLTEGEVATVYGKISKLKAKKSFNTGKPMGEGEIEDLSSKIKITWWGQAYLAKMLKNGDSVKLTGRVSKGKYGLYLSNPEFEKMENLPIDSHKNLFRTKDKQETGLSYPIYKETRGITSKWIYHHILKILKDGVLNTKKDYIPKEILKKYNLPSLKTAFFWIHSPKKKIDAEAARKRFSFEEILFIQLERQKDKILYKQNKSFKIKKDADKVKEFLNRFPFKPTNSQTRAIKTILFDMSKNFPMSRLLEGDVGSGKTLVAATTSYAAVMQRPFDYQKKEFQSFGNLQVAYMAPTEILASQHFESFIEYFKHLPIQIGLITGSGCKKFPSKSDPETWTNISRRQLLKWVEEGSISILIGTHSLIQKSVKFKDLSYIIIDEQHRFGTNQRKKFARREQGEDVSLPHLLSMTATPIPRTLALTIYGDLDLSLLDQMPKGRKPIITSIVPPNKRNKTYEEIRDRLNGGRQLYVICPRIFEPDKDKAKTLDVKSVTAEAKRLKKEIYKDKIIGILHSKMTKIKKEEVMRDFAEGKIDILCATSVVEVGVNVPNATMIIIEGAERFGLAQLHQLRGRVIRSSYQAYCYIFANAKTDKTIERLNALKTAKNGFELAEMDLNLRGAGELSGTKQWGISDLGMEAIKNIKMVEAAREEAKKIISEDLTLENYPLLKARAKYKVSEFHFE